MKQIVAYDMADYRRQCAQLESEIHGDGSLWEPENGSIEELTLTKAVEATFPGHVELTELDDIPYPTQVH